MLVIKRRGRAIIFCYKYILLYMYLCKINNLKFLFGLILPLSVRDYQNLVIKIHEHEKCICWNFTIIFSIFNWLISDAFERFNCNIFVNDHQYRYLFQDKNCSSLFIWLCYWMLFILFTGGWNRHNRFKYGDS